MSIEIDGWKQVYGLLTKTEIKELVKVLNLPDGEEGFFKSLPKWQFTNPIIKKLEKALLDNAKDHYIYRNIVLDKIWFVKTINENSKPGKLPYVPHFDKRRYLKLMVYLTDVTTNDGPFTTSTTNVNFYDDRRKNLPPNHGEAQLNYVETDKNYKQILLNAGDAVIFDTNCPHFACPVNKGGNREILRLDFEDYNWNSEFDPITRRIWKKSKLNLKNSIFRVKI